MLQPCPVCQVPCPTEVLTVELEGQNKLRQSLHRCPTHGRRVVHESIAAPDQAPKPAPMLYNAGPGVCEGCGGDYTKRKRSQRFCCNKCRDAKLKGKPKGIGPGNGNCEHCGELFAKKAHTSRFCCRQCAALGRRYTPA